MEAWNELSKLEKTTFKIVPHILLVCTYVRKLYEEFKPYLPVINDLRNPSLKKRHFKRLNELLSVELDEELTIPFKILRDSHNVMQFREEIREISEISNKESGFERVINRMKSDWRTIRFELTEFRDTGALILRTVEPILDKLDEDIAKTMSIFSSPFVKFLENEVNTWRSQLLRTQETIELWCKVQRSWQYLQPIFFSEDIIREMPKEGSKYNMVDKMWKGIM
jgi:dynein heavy chain